MTEEARVTPTSRVLEIGTGSGYQAAVLAAITNHVFSIEIKEPLAKRARESLDAAGYRAVTSIPVLSAGDGSNNWVVSGEHTESGLPILADDTHLSVQMPSIWYENHLCGGDYDVVGLSFPGLPGVVAGHLDPPRPGERRGDEGVRQIVGGGDDGSSFHGQGTLFDQ